VTLRFSLIGLVIGALITMPVLWLAMLLASVGQGTPYTAPRVLFPFAMFATCFPKPSCGGFMLGALLQFPVYGLILGAAYHSRRFRLLVIALVVLNILAAVVLPLYTPLS
jgi:hypothetical protein